MYTIDIAGSRLRFRPTIEDDAALVTTWRNTELARQSFFAKEVVTPDSHIAFCRHRKPHDLVWIVEARLDLSAEKYLDSGNYAAAVCFDWYPIGMTSLTVNVKYHTAEYGRTLIAEQYQGQGYAKELEYFTLWLAFEWLRLKFLWLDAYITNTAVINLHHRTGWRDNGVNLPDHSHPGGDVLNMVYYKNDWPENRAKFVELFGVELPEYR